MRIIHVLLTVTTLGGCAIGVPLGQKMAAGVHDYCSHSEQHKLLVMDEVNETLAKYAEANKEPRNEMPAPVCGSAGSNH